ncbi:hypothetical protein JKP88DRAFT_272821 [Tribonema minus]|uniref:Ubiquitin-like protease family profile domain-containing protein n=1 Tax=Tribonema minus TaxID=303371 RepID=A0A835YWN4_9STRA|nr:hypothetical protein JKP88DRAFT_272821 [Tribonema minus]
MAATSSSSSSSSAEAPTWPYLPVPLLPSFMKKKHMARAPQEELQALLSEAQRVKTDEGACATLGTLTLRKKHVMDIINSQRGLPWRALEMYAELLNAQEPEAGTSGGEASSRRAVTFGPVGAGSIVLRHPENIPKDQQKEELRRIDDADVLAVIYNMDSTSCSPPPATCWGLVCVIAVDGKAHTRVLLSHGYDDAAAEHHTGVTRALFCVVKRLPHGSDVRRVLPEGADGAVAVLVAMRWLAMQDCDPLRVADVLADYGPHGCGAALKDHRDGIVRDLLLLHPDPAERKRRITRTLALDTPTLEIADDDDDGPAHPAPAVRADMPPFLRSRTDRDPEPELLLLTQANDRLDLFGRNGAPVAFVHGYPLTAADMQRLWDPSAYLNDSIVNNAFLMIVAHFPDGTVVSVASLAAQTLMKARGVPAMSAKLHRRKGTSLHAVFAPDSAVRQVFFPFHVNGNHWTLLHARRDAQESNVRWRLDYYDSLIGLADNEGRELVAAFADYVSGAEASRSQGRSPVIETSFVDRGRCPQQPDGCNCGLMVLLYARALAFGQDVGAVLGPASRTEKATRAFLRVERRRLSADFLCFHPSPDITQGRLKRKMCLDDEHRRALSRRKTDPAPAVSEGITSAAPIEV